MTAEEMSPADREAWAGATGLPVGRGCGPLLNVLILLSCCSMCTVPGALGKRRAANEREAAAFLREIAVAQERFRDEDPDRDAEPDYAVSIYELVQANLLGEDRAAGRSRGYVIEIQATERDWQATAFPEGRWDGRFALIVCRDGVLRSVERGEVPTCGSPPLDTEAAGVAAGSGEPPPGEPLAPEPTRDAPTPDEPTPEPERPEEEVRAIAVLRAVAEAQDSFRRLDLDEDEVEDFAIDLAELVQGGLPGEATEALTLEEEGYAYSLDFGPDDWSCTARPADEEAGLRRYIVCRDGVVRSAPPGEPVDCSSEPVP